MQIADACGPVSITEPPTLNVLSALAGHGFVDVMFTTTIAVPGICPLNTRTVVVPVATAVTSPTELTVATFGSSLTKVAVSPVTVLLNASSPVTDSCAVCPTLDSFVVSGASVIFDSAPAATVAVKVAVPAPLTVAVAVCAPAADPGVHCAVAYPAASLVEVAGEIDPDAVPHETDDPLTA